MSTSLWASENLIRITLLLLISISISTSTRCAAQTIESPEKHLFGSPFNNSYYDIMSVEYPATISNGALQITPDSANNNFQLKNNSGRVLFSQSFKLWEGLPNSTYERIASFETSFLINIYRFPNTTPGEGFAFIIAPDLKTPPSSQGQYLGLTNVTTDENPTNHLIAVELDTVKQEFDPDDNHMGLDINSIRSVKSVPLSNYGIEIAPEKPKNYTVWIKYDGQAKLLTAYMAEEGVGINSTTKAILNESLNIRDYVKQNSYFGFAASTGNLTQLNCVLGWNLTVEMLPKEEEEKEEREWVKILVGVGVPAVAAILMIGAVGLWYYVQRRNAAANDPNILGALKSLPGTPREFGFKDLKKATENFDERHKLGQGGFGVVYKGVLPKEKVEVAVKKFSRDNIKGKDDFLAELTIINRLRHKHLVPLLGWCHRNGMLLLVYDYMPNGSLDGHLFGDQDHKTLSWERRSKVISGVASALHYLHNEYDQRVVHRDLKASNIMLDSDYNARLGDFGLARALENEKTSYAELEGVPGTMGYIAPECFHTGKATRESDVYGFGAVVLEVVCGQRPWTKIAGFQFLVDWVWTLYRDGRVLEAVDERLGNEFVAEEAERLLLLGLACSHPIAGERPKTQAIVQMVSGSVPAPYVPPFKPAFVWPMMEPLDDDDDYNSSNTKTHPPIITSSSSSSSSYNVSARRSPLSMSRENHTANYTDASLMA